MAKQHDRTETRPETPTPPPGTAFAAAPAAPSERDALRQEIAELREKLARATAETGRYTPAPAAQQQAGAPLRAYLVSLDHVHKGLVTPSAYFAQQAAGINPGRAGQAIRAAGEHDAGRPELSAFSKELIRQRAEAEAAAADAAERALIDRGRPVYAVSAADAKATFCRLHGIEGWSGQGPEVRELTEEELQTGQWGPPPVPADRFKARVPERPKLPQPAGPTAARDTALSEALTF